MNLWFWADWIEQRCGGLFSLSFSPLLLFMAHIFTYSISNACHIYVTRIWNMANALKSVGVANELIFKCKYVFWALFEYACEHPNVHIPYAQNYIHVLSLESQLTIWWCPKCLVQANKISFWIAQVINKCMPLDIHISRIHPAEIIIIPFELYQIIRSSQYIHFVDRI